MRATSPYLHPTDFAHEIRIQRMHWLAPSHPQSVVTNVCIGTLVSFSRSGIVTKQNDKKSIRRLLTKHHHSNNRYLSLQ